METLTIGQLARGAGLNVETIRFYERRGSSLAACSGDGTTTGRLSLDVGEPGAPADERSPDGCGHHG